MVNQTFARLISQSIDASEKFVKCSSDYFSEGEGKERGEAAKAKIRKAVLTWRKARGRVAEVRNSLPWQEPKITKPPPLPHVETF
jgi:hypothetical protein